MSSIEKDSRNTPEKRKKPGEDCLGCRISGTAAFWGISGYAFYLLRTRQKISVTDKRFYALVGVCSALIGFYRGFIY